MTDAHGTGIIVKPNPDTLAEIPCPVCGGAVAAYPFLGSTWEVLSCIICDWSDLVLAMPDRLSVVPENKNN
jgi:hypothetical protein